MKNKLSPEKKRRRAFITSLLLVSLCLAVTIITDTAYLMIKSATEAHNADYEAELVTAAAELSPGYIWIAVLVLLMWSSTTVLCLYFKKQYFHLFTGYIFAAALPGYTWYAFTVFAGSPSTSISALIFQMCSGVFAYIADPIWDACGADTKLIAAFSLVLQAAFAVLNFYFHKCVKKAVTKKPCA